MQQSSHTAGCGYYLAAIVIVPLLVYVGLAYNHKEPQPIELATHPKIEPQRPEGGLVLDSWEWSNSRTELVGYVNNTSSMTYKYAQIQFNLYDNEGALVGSTMTNVNNLEPGDRWKFKAMVIYRDATVAKFKSLTGF